MSKHPDTTECRSSWINPIFTDTKDESWYCQEHKEPVWPNKDLDPSSSPLSDILTDLYISTHGGKVPIAIKGSDAEPDVLDFRQAEQALTALLEAAIGSEAHTGTHGLLGWNLSTCRECRNLQIKQKLGIPEKETTHD